MDGVKGCGDGDLGGPGGGGGASVARIVVSLPLSLPPRGRLFAKGQIFFATPFLSLLCADPICRLDFSHPFGVG